MNKKLVVTAMGVALAAGMSLANADVKLYGQLDMSLDSVDVDGGDDDINMGSNRSAVGFKGSEDLGDGLSAFFKSEWQVDLDDAGTAAGPLEDDTTEGGDSDGWKARDQYIGIKAEGFGKLTFGMMSTAYKSPASKLDPFYRTRNQSRNIGLQSSLHKGRGEEGQGRATNTVRYDSPTFAGGAKVFGTYTFDNDESDGEDDDPYSLGASYKAGNIYAFASYLTTQAGGDDEATQFGLKYTFGDAAVWGMYEIDGGLISGDKDADIFNIGASYTIGNNLVSFDYAEGAESDNNAVPEYTTWRLGGYHKFSNRTRVYATFAQVDVDNAGEVDIFSLGLRHNF
jgi:predicted porin